MTQKPVLIESAISPFRRGEPVRDAAGTAAVAKDCLAAGARIIHYHHDFRMSPEDSLTEMIAVSKDVLSEHPDALLYPDFIATKVLEEKISHFLPLAAAGMIGLLPVDPGTVMFGGYDDDHLPVTASHFWTSYNDAHEHVRISTETGVPLTFGVYEPGNMRFPLAYAAAGKLPPGSMLKLYFGGSHSIYDLGKEAVNFGLPPTKPALDAYLDMIGDLDIEWNVGVQGAPLLDSPLAKYALERGGHLRIGIEDAAGLSPLSDVEMVHAAVALANEVGRPIAAPDEAAAVLGLR